MWKYRVGTILLGPLLSVSALAFDATDLVRLIETRACPGCDLRAADLHAADLAHADLRGADLREAKLDSANLDGASLRGADLSRATGAFLRMARADLSGARLVGFRACYDQDFTDSVFRGADLSSAVLCATDWHGADLTGAILSGADMTLAVELTQAQLDLACGDSSTRLPGAELTIRRCDTAP